MQILKKIFFEMLQEQKLMHELICFKKLNMLFLVAKLLTVR